jgi:hypothetical protein
MKYFVWVAVMLLTYAFPAHAASWSNNASEDGVMLYAVVSNEEGNTLGQYCSASNGRCLWMITMTNECDTGMQIPIMINGEGGVIPTTVLCNGKTMPGADEYQYLFSDFDAIDGIVLNSANVTIVFPVSGDRFGVSRFSLGDAATALDTMHLRAYDAMQRSEPNSARDISL